MPRLALRSGQRLRACALVVAMSLVGACDQGGPTQPVPVGLDLEAIEALVADARSGAYGELHSMVIGTGSRAPAEYYFRGHTRETPGAIYSISKSVTALLAGIAIAEGHLDSVKAPLTTLLPTRDSLLRADSLRERITLQDLLTMRAGIAWNEFAWAYDSPLNPVTLMLGSSDWVGYVLSRPMTRAPGSAYNYNTGVSVVIGDVIATAAGMPLADFARTRLLAPLGIPDYAWHTGPLGVANSGSGMTMRPIDLYALGRLVRDGGRVGDQQLVPTAWVQEALTPVVNAPLGSRYGYQWWWVDVGNDTVPSTVVHFALGWGGQMVLYIPAHDLIAVFTAGNFRTDPLGVAIGLAGRLVSAARP